MISEAQRDASVKFCSDMKPIEVKHDEVVSNLKGLYNSILFNVKDIKLSHRLRKEVEEIQGLHYTELKLITNALRNHYI